MTQDLAPLCPVCSGAMQLRTARRGRNAGGQFYGCLKYPNCKGTVDASGVAGPTDGYSEYPRHVAGPATSPFELPREVVVAPRHAGWQARVFQSAALPSSFVSAVHENDTERSVVRNFAHWRLDYPFPKDADRNRVLESVFAVAEAMLSRGAVPLCSTVTERLLASDDEPTEAEDVTGALLGVGLSPTIPFEQVEFDSEAEREFITWARNATSFGSRGWSVTPQVQLRSLAFPVDTVAGERVDFAFVHPTAGVLVVEIDGAQHEAHRAVDNARDVSLSAVGIASIRVPGREVDGRQGANLKPYDCD